MKRFRYYQLKELNKSYLKFVVILLPLEDWALMDSVAGGRLVTVMERTYSRS